MASYIQVAVPNVNWKFFCQGTDVNKNVDLLNECLKNIFHNFVQNRIKCNYRHQPMMTDIVKSKVIEKSTSTKRYFKIW